MTWPEILSAFLGGALVLCANTAERSEVIRLLMSEGFEPSFRLETLSVSGDTNQDLDRLPEFCFAGSDGPGTFTFYNNTFPTGDRAVVTAKLFLSLCDDGLDEPSDEQFRAAISDLYGSAI